MLEISLMVETLKRKWWKVSEMEVPSWRGLLGFHGWRRNPMNRALDYVGIPDHGFGAKGGTQQWKAASVQKVGIDGGESINADQVRHPATKKGITNRWKKRNKWKTSRRPQLGMFSPLRWWISTPPSFLHDWGGKPWLLPSGWDNTIEPCLGLPRGCLGSAAACTTCFKTLRHSPDVAKIVDHVGVIPRPNGIEVSVPPPRAPFLATDRVDRHKKSVNMNN